MRELTLSGYRGVPSKESDSYQMWSVNIAIMEFLFEE